MLFKSMESAHDRFISVWVLPHLWVPESLEYQQLFYWIQAILESRHVAAFTKKWIQSSCVQSSPIFTSNIFLNIGQNCVPLHCSIKISFILFMMSSHSHYHLWDVWWQRIGIIWADCRNRDPLPVLHSNFFLCTNSCTRLPCTKVYYW